MTTLQVKQQQVDGISFLLTHVKGAGNAAASVRLQLVTKDVDDNFGFLDESVIMTDSGANQTGTITLSPAQLSALYIGTAAPYNLTLTMNAKSLDSAGLELASQTQIVDATNTNIALNQVNALTFAVPSRPVITALTGYDQNVSISFTTTTLTSQPLILGASNKANVEILTHGGAAIVTQVQEAAVHGTANDVDGTTTHTITVTTDADAFPMINGQTYELALRVSNTNGDSLYSLTQGVVPNNKPQTLADLTTATAFSAGTTLDTVNAAIVSANFLDDNAAGEITVEWGVVVAGEFVGAQSSTKTLVASDHVEGATVGDLDIPKAWFIDGLTSIEIEGRINQTVAGVTTSGDRVSFGNVFNIQLPTIGDITIEGVTGEGVQTFNMNGNGSSIDGTATMAFTYPNSGGSIDVTMDGTSFTMDADLSLTYDEVTAGTNGDLTFQASLGDANGTQQEGVLVQHLSNVSTQALHAFKDAIAPTVSITAGGATVVPTIEVTVDQNNNGYTLTNYTAIVSSDADVVVATYTTDGSTLLATATDGGVYLVGNHDVTFTKNLAGIPVDYEGKYTLSAPSTTSGVVLYFEHPTIVSVSIAGSVMTISGNTNGALFDDAAVTSIAFKGTAANLDMSTLSANMVIAGDRTYSVAINHGGALLTNVSANVATFDGIAFVNSNNANSAFALVTDQ